MIVSSRMLKSKSLLEGAESPRLATRSCRSRWEGRERNSSLPRAVSGEEGKDRVVKRLVGSWNGIAMISLMVQELGDDAGVGPMVMRRRRTRC